MKTALLAMLTAFAFPVFFQEIIIGHPALLFSFSVALLMGLLVFFKPEIFCGGAQKSVASGEQFVEPGEALVTSSESAGACSLATFVALLAAGIAAFSVFLPWLSAASDSLLSMRNLSITVPGQTEAVSGHSVSGGMLGLFLTFAGGIMALRESKWAFTAGIANVLVGISYLLFAGTGDAGCVGSSFVTGSGIIPVSLTGMCNPQIGLYLFTGSSLLFAVFSLRRFLVG